MKTTLGALTVAIGVLLLAGQLLRAEELSERKTIQTAIYPKHLVFTPDGGTVLYAADSVGVTDPGGRLHDILDKEAKDREIPCGSRFLLLFSPDGKTVATVGAHGGVSLHVLPGGKYISTFLNGAEESALAMSADWKMLASASGSRVRLWNVAKEKQRNVFDKDGVKSWSFLAFDPEGKTLYAGGAKMDGKQVFVAWDVETGNDAETALKLDEKTECLMLTPDGKTLLTRDGAKITLWDVKKGEAKTTFEHKENVSSAAFTPDFKTLVTRAGKFITLWDVEKGEARAVLENPEAVTAVAFTADAKTVFAAVDMKVLLWDAGRKKRRGSFEVHTSRIADLALSPDEKTLASVADTYLILWDVNVEKDK